MAIFDLKANIDLKQNLNLYTTCKQLDSLNLILSVFDNSVQTNLTNYNVRLKAMKADKVPLVQEHTGISISSNVITIETDEQLTITSGKTLIELQFTDKGTGKKKATFNLVLIVVSTTLEVDRGISKATYTLLEELENKLDQASDFFENIEDAIVANNNLKKTISNSETAESNLETAITNANNKKNEVDEAITNATNKIEEVEQSIINANNSKTELDASKTIADTTKIDLDNANVQAEKNIEELNKLGDATDLAAKVQTNTENISKNTKSIEEVNSQMNEIAKPSLLINGDFLINQRGQTQYNKNYKYTVDRWYLSNMNKDVITEKGVLNVYDGFVELTGMGDYQLYIQQTSNEVKQLQNKTVTFSVDARVENMSKGNIFVQFSYKYNSNQSGLGKKTFDNTQLNGEWKRISVTLTIPNYKLDQFWAQCGSFSDPDNGYLPVNTECKIQFRNAKLEVGDKATPFIPRLYGEELALCKRYYQKNVIIGIANTSNVIHCVNYFNPVFGVSPTLILKPKYVLHSHGFGDIASSAGTLQFLGFNQYNGGAIQCENPILTQGQVYLLDSVQFDAEIY